MQPTALTNIVRRAIARMDSGGASRLYSADPVIFANRLGFFPDPWQAEFLRSSGDVLLNCSRQSGKSTCTALLAYHTAVGIPDSLILLLSPSLRQSQELFRKVLDFHGEADIDTDVENKLSIELVNGSRIVSLPGTERTVKGFSAPRLIVIDEAARVVDQLYFSIRPMLAASQNGRLLMLSTPFGKTGFFFEAWQNGGDAFSRFEVPAPLVPRISADFLEQERRTMPAYWFNQEYLCRFEDAETAAFSYEDVQAALHGRQVTAWTI